MAIVKHFLDGWVGTQRLGLMTSVNPKGLQPWFLVSLAGCWSVTFSPFSVGAETGFGLEHNDSWSWQLPSGSIRGPDNVVFPTGVACDVIKHSSFPSKLSTRSQWKVQGVYSSLTKKILKHLSKYMTIWLDTIAIPRQLRNYPNKGDMQKSPEKASKWTFSNVWTICGESVLCLAVYQLVSNNFKCPCKPIIKLK